MSDIAKQSRLECRVLEGTKNVLKEAAAEIDRLREALRAVLDRAEAEYQVLTDGGHGRFADFREAKAAKALLEPVS